MNLHEARRGTQGQLIATRIELLCFFGDSAGIPMISPFSRIRSWWDTIVGLGVAYLALFVPLQVAFDDRMGNGWDAPNLMIDIMFIMDICVNFRTCYLEDGMYVVSSYKVAENYFRGSFGFDATVGIPWHLIFQPVV